MCPCWLWALAQPIACSSVMLYLLRCSVLAVGGCAGRAVSECHVLLQSPVRSQPQKLRAARAELRWGRCCGLGPATASRRTQDLGCLQEQRCGWSQERAACHPRPCSVCERASPGTAPQSAGRHRGCHGPQGLGQPHVPIWGCDTTGQRLLTLHRDLPAPERFGGDRPRFGREMWERVWRGGLPPNFCVAPPGHDGAFLGEGQGAGCPRWWPCGQDGGLATALIPPLLGTALLLAGDITREPTPCLLSVSLSRSLIHRQRWQEQGLCESRRQQHACGVWGSGRENHVRCPPEPPPLPASASPSRNFTAPSCVVRASPGGLDADSRMHDTPKRRENDHKYPGTHGY